MPISKARQNGHDVLAFDVSGAMLFAVRGKLKGHADGWVAVEHLNKIIAYDEKGALAATFAIDGWIKGARP
jgi:hypothetical protein